MLNRQMSQEGRLVTHSDKERYQKPRKLFLLLDEKHPAVQNGTPQQVYHLPEKYVRLVLLNHCHRVRGVNRIIAEECQVRRLLHTEARIGWHVLWVPRRTERDRARQSGGVAPKHSLATGEKQECVDHTATNTAAGLSIL